MEGSKRSLRVEPGKNGKDPLAKIESCAANAVNSRGPGDKFYASLAFSFSLFTMKLKCSRKGGPFYDDGGGMKSHSGEGYFVRGGGRGRKRPKPPLFF